MLASRFRNSLHHDIRLPANFGIEGHQQPIDASVALASKFANVPDIDEWANFVAAALV